LHEETQALDSNIHALVHIVGPRKLQNELMSGFTERETGLKCMCYEDPGLCVFDMNTDLRSVSLWDRLGFGLSSQCSVALFNVSPALKICRGAVNKGVQGIFLENENTHASTNKGV
jgi:hypothetical protein